MCSLPSSSGHRDGKDKSYSLKQLTYEPHNLLLFVSHRNTNKLIPENKQSTKNGRFE